jgi:hypothetical protein
MEVLDVRIGSANKANAGVIETFTLLGQPSMSWLHADMKNIFCFNRLKNDDSRNFHISQFVESLSDGSIS